MPYQLSDNWQYYFDTGFDTRQSSIQRNGTGTNYNGTANFDYFVDNAGVNEFIAFYSIRRYWGIRINVGTPFQAISVQFVWEYSSGYNSWSPLRVDNPDAFLTTGQKDINFTPPSNWYCYREKGYAIRCRITSVLGITEGGANSTSVVRFNHRAIRITGTETNINGAITLNDNNSYTILPATAPSTSLTPMQMPVGLVRDIAKVDCILSGCVFGIGSNIVLTGTDIDGNTISETINATANGTYTSSLAYADITNISCNSITGGTITVNQKKLGMIERVSENTYVFNCFLEIGDGSTTTNVTFLDYAFIFLRGAHFHVRANAVFTCGQVLAANTPSENYNRGLYIQEGTYGGGDWGIGSDIRSYMNTGTLNLYGSYFHSISSPYSEALFRPSGSCFLNLRGSLIKSSDVGFGQLYGSSTTTFIKDSSVTLSYQTASGDQPTFQNTSFAKINAEIVSNNPVYNACRISQQPMYIWFYNGSGVATYLDCPGVSTSSFAIGWNGAGNGNEKIRISYTYNLLVLDEYKQPVENASVRIIDGTGYTINTTTNSNGKIPTQYLRAYSGSYVAYSPSITWVDRRNYTIIIRKNGYQPVVKKFTLTERIDEVVVLVRQNLEVDQEILYL